MTSITIDTNECADYITQLKFREFKLNWTIEDFKLVWNKAKVIESPKFPSNYTEDGQWYLKIVFPDIKDVEQDKFKIYLHNTECRKLIKCKIMFTNFFGKTSRGLYCNLEAFNNSIVWTYPINKLFVEQLDWDKEEVRSIKVHCKVMILDSKTLIPKELNRDPKKDNLLNQIENSFDDPTLKDVTFKVKDQEFTAHKCILSIRSPVFAAMFQSKMSEQLTSVIEVEDIEPAVFQQLINFIYTDRVQNIHESASQLYYAAEKYQLEKMKTTIVKSLYANLSSETVLETLKILDKFSISNLEEKCLKYLVLNLDKLKETSEFAEFVTMYPRYSLEIIRMLMVIDSEVHDDFKFSETTKIEYKK